MKMRIFRIYDGSLINIKVVLNFLGLFKVFAPMRFLFMEINKEAFLVLHKFKTNSNLIKAVLSLYCDLLCPSRHKSLFLFRVFYMKKKSSEQQHPF